MARGVNLKDLNSSVSRRKEAALKYRAAYHPYVWPVENLDDLRIAPFHILASEGGVHRDKDHLWHMAHCHGLAETGDTLFFPTQYKIVDLSDTGMRADATKWWRRRHGGQTPQFYSRRKEERNCSARSQSAG